MEKINQEKKSLNKPGERFRYGRNTRYSYKRPKYVISQNMVVFERLIDKFLVGSK